MKGSFNLEKFYGVVDAERTVRRLNWKQVAEESGVSAATLTRMNYGKRPDVDGLAALLKWGGFPLASFVDDGSEMQADTLAEILRLLRSDDRLPSTSVEMLESVLMTAYSQITRPNQ